LHETRAHRALVRVRGGLTRGARAQVLFAAHKQQLHAAEIEQLRHGLDVSAEPATEARAAPQRPAAPAAQLRPRGRGSSARCVVPGARPTWACVRGSRITVGQRAASSGSWRPGGAPALMTLYLNRGLRVRRQGCRAPDTPAAASAPAAPAGAPEPGGEAGPQGGSERGSAPSLLADLLAAAVHARAAYGYAMAAGHLSSIAKFAMLHTARRPRRGLGGRPCLRAGEGERRRCVKPCACSSTCALAARKWLQNSSGAVV